MSWGGMRSAARVVAADVLDRGEVVLGGHLTDRDQLHTVLLAARGIHEQVAEVAGPLLLFIASRRL
jgi:hypothetical protein